MTTPAGDQHAPDRTGLTPAGESSLDRVAEMPRVWDMAIMRGGMVSYTVTAVVPFASDNAGVFAGRSELYRDETGVCRTEYMHVHMAFAAWRDLVHYGACSVRVPV